VRQRSLTAARENRRFLAQEMSPTMDKSIWTPPTAATDPIVDVRCLTQRKPTGTGVPAAGVSVLIVNDTTSSPKAFATEAKLLLIEDSPLLQVRLRRHLETSGAVRVAGIVDSAPAAVQSIDSEPFDVLIVDVELKKGSGIDVIRHARTHYPADRQPLIIVLTNYALPEVEIRCRRAGADHFLDKMRHFSDLLPLIRQWRENARVAGG
jgi:CheY-like chemotaxis protein